MNASKVGEYDIVQELVPGTCTWMLLKSPDNSQFVVQAVTAQLSGQERRRLAAQAEKAQRIGNRNLISSTQKIDLPGYSYALRYDRAIQADLASPIEMHVSRDPESIKQIAKSALALLEEVHRNGLTIGVFTPRSILWTGGQAKFYSFLYDSLIREDAADIRMTGANMIAPELRRPNAAEPTPASDIWSLANLLGGVLANSRLILDSQWYAKCHAMDPAQRPASAAEALVLFRTEILGDIPLRPDDEPPAPRPGPSAGGSTARPAGPSNPPAGTGRAQPAADPAPSTPKSSAAPAAPAAQPARQAPEPTRAEPSPFDFAQSDTPQPAHPAGWDIPLVEDEDVPPEPPKKQDPNAEEWGSVSEQPVERDPRRDMVEARLKALGKERAVSFFIGVIMLAGFITITLVLAVLIRGIAK